jgi:ABC-type transport system involved in cytochrome c biogenesis ATPase subunit
MSSEPRISTNCAPASFKTWHGRATDRLDSCAAQEPAALRGSIRTPMMSEMITNRKRRIALRQLSEPREPLFILDSDHDILQLDQNRKA